MLWKSEGNYHVARTKFALIIVVKMVNQFEQKNETMKQRMLVAVIQNEFFNETISLLNDKSLSEY